MRPVLATILIASAACSGGGGDDGPGPGPVERDPRFVGLWAVEQPNHALYEVTYYGFGADGVVTTGPSEPAGCSGHLSRHCVTGSVARCQPDESGTCDAEPSCVFGDAWRSRGPDVLVIAGVCSDGVGRDIAIGLDPDPSSNTAWGGAGGTVLTVGGEPGWSHDNWEWAFRKCPPGTGPTNCVP